MTSNIIPKKIFQTWKTLNISDNFKSLIDSWKINNPDYEHVLYDNEMCRDFIANNFDADVLYTYDKINPGAFKADLWRYCILYKYGGFYADVDSLCFNSINKFVTNPNVEFIIPIDLNRCINKHCLFNGFIGTIPNNPILLECITQIVHNVKHGIIPAFNLDICGPGLIGQKTNIYLGLHEKDSFVGKEGFLNISDGPGPIKSIHFLRFRERDEFVTDYKHNMLFQNKNGNSNISNIYRAECNTCNINSDWNASNPY
jgi:hypothetical protein